jgi:HAD superfamily (subfamily IA) hydrolase, TIGR02254
MPQYKHLFFDLDHTLWDFDANAKETLAELYSIFDLNNRIKIDFEDFYPKYLFHNEVLWDRYHKGLISSEDLKWKRMWRTMLDFKIADEPLAKEMSGKFLDILPTKKLLFPHTLEILNYLKEKNYDLHLITNGFEKTQQSKLTNSGLTRFFTHVITSEGSNSLKPKKEIFEFAMDKAKSTVADSIMIGDNLDADIQGAMNAGMDTVFVNHINAECVIKPTYIITHLQQLEDIF